VTSTASLTFPSVRKRGTVLVGVSAVPDRPVTEAYIALILGYVTLRELTAPENPPLLGNC